MADDEAAVWRRNERWTGAELDDSFVVVDPDSGKYFVLNRTAAIIWEALAAPCTQSQLEQRLVREFEVSAEDCHRSVTALLEEMRALDLSIQDAT